MSYKTTVQALSPLYYWPLDETSGTSAADASGNGNTATASGSGILGGATGIPADGAGKAALMAGAGETITPGVSTLVPTGNSPFTIKVWIKPTSFSAAVSTVAWGDLSSEGVSLAPVSATEIAVVRAAAEPLDATGLSSLTDGNWHMAVLTWDGTTLKLYVDGAFVTSTTPGAFALTATLLVLGASSLDTSITGAMAHPAIWGSALSSGTITALYNAGTGTPPNAPTGLTATPNTLTGAIDLAWTAPAGGSPPDTYTVERSTSTNTETSYHTGVIGTAYSDTGVTPGTHYYYKVAGVNVGGMGALSTEASAIAPPAVIQRACVIRLPTLLDGGGAPRVGVRHTWRYLSQGNGITTDGGLAGLSQKETDLFTDSSGNASMTVIAPLDCLPASITVFVTYDADDANPTQYETTSFAYSGSTRNLVDVLPVSGTLPTVQMIALEVLPDGTGAQVSISISTNQSTNVSGTVFHIPGNTPIAGLTTDSLGRRIVNLPPSSLLDGGTVYQLSIDGQTYTIRVPDQSEIDGDPTLAYLLNPALRTAATTGTQGLIADTGIASTNPPTRSVTSPATLANEISNLLVRIADLEQYGARGKQTFGNFHIFM